MTMFFRDGTQFTGTAHGNPPVGSRFIRCDRCGGPGRIDHFRHVEGGICFKCNGHQGFTKAARLYTAEQLAQLNATAEKRAAKKHAKHVEAQAALKREAEARAQAFEAEHREILRWLEACALDDDGNVKSGFLGTMLIIAREHSAWTDKQREFVYAAHAKAQAEKAAAAASRHVGEVGQRLEVTVTAVREAVFYRQVAWGYRGQEAVYITTLRDSEGNTFVVKSPAFRAQVGETLTIRGTVKEHSEYRGELQTVLNRVR